MPLFRRPTFYITNDVERALWPGWEDDPNYYIVTYKNPYSEWLEKRQASNLRRSTSKTHVVLIDGPKGSTAELMKHKHVMTFITSERQKAAPSRGKSVNIIVFKPTVEIEEWCKTMGWKLLNPSSKFGERFEEKIVQTALLKKLNLRTPKTIVATIGDVYVQTNTVALRQVRNTEQNSVIDVPAILQFNLGHTGEGTYLIQRASDLKPFQKFPKRPARVAEFIDGIPLTVNALVGKRVYVSAPSLQITGIRALTPFPFATVGNDWAYVSRTSNVGTSIRSELRRIVITIGNELKRQGYRGAFGVDLVLGKNRKLHVIEVNARQTNSFVYESEVQRLRYGVQGIEGETTMGLYFKCLLGCDTGKETLPETLEGAQVLVRAQKDMKWQKDITPNNTEHYFYFSKLTKGDVVKRNAEVLRVQSNEGVVMGGRMWLKEGVLDVIRRYVNVK